MLPGRRTAVIGVVVLAVLAGATWVYKPWWQPWWYARTLCGGALSGGDLADLLPKERLRAGEDTFGSGDGTSVACEVDRPDGYHYVLRAEATTDGAEPDGPLDLEFTIPRDPQYLYSREIPGFHGNLGPMIVQDCPALGRDAEGRIRRLVTNVYSLAVERKPEATPARMAVQIANRANDELGCGAARLPVPDRLEPAHRLSLRQARATMCGGLARAALPRSPSGKDWQVLAPTGGRAPISSCSLVDSGTGRTAATFTGWYGDWTDKPFERLLGANVQIPDGHSVRDALLGENFGRATARCAGESANFLVNSYAPHGTGPVLPMSELRALLGVFAKEEAGRRGCDGLELPGRTVYPAQDR
nr:hypothetical protein [Streptomyces sp. SID5785]